jgi:3-oxoacyl-[acyl-carrier protein] reductase
MASLDKVTVIIGYGRPDEVADLLALMVSPAAKWMTGASLRIDSGESKGV